MGKTALRKQFIDYRNQLDPLMHEFLSRRVQQRVLNSETFRCSQMLALYSPVNNEVATAQIFAVARDRCKLVCYPRVVDDMLEFVEVSKIDELICGTFGVAEPIGNNKRSIAEFDLVVVPGIAFDLRGYRLGYGRGYYDRQLAEDMAKTVTVGLGFEFQLHRRLPIAAHDERLDYIATETRLISCRS